MKSLFYLVLLLAFHGWMQAQEALLEDSCAELTLQAIEDLALQNNQTLQAQLHTLRQSDYVYQEAKGNYLPQVSVFAEAGMRKEGQYSANYLVSLKQVLYHPVLYYGTREASLRYELAKLELERQIIEILFQVRQAYYQALLAQKRVEIDQGAIFLFKEGLRKYTHQFNAGLATASELNQMKLALIRATSNFYDSQKKFKDHFYKLLILLSLPPETEIELNDAEIPLPAIVEGLGEWDEEGELIFETLCQPEVLGQWESVVSQYNPEIQRGWVNQDLAQLEIKKREAGYYPSVDLFANAGHACSRQDNFCWNSNWSTGVQLNWTLFDGWKTHNRIRQAQESDQATAYLTSQTELTIKIEVRRLLMDIEKAYQTYLMTQQGEQIAQEGLEIVKKQQQLNLMTTLEYREAVQAWQLAEQEINQAKVNLLLAYYNLIRHSGYDLKECL